MKYHAVCKWRGNFYFLRDRPFYREQSAGQDLENAATFKSVKEGEEFLRRRRHVLLGSYMIMTRKQITEERIMEKTLRAMGVEERIQ